MGMTLTHEMIFTLAFEYLPVAPFENQVYGIMTRTQSQKSQHESCLISFKAVFLVPSSLTSHT